MGEKTNMDINIDYGHYSKMIGNDTNSTFSVYDKNSSEKGHYRSN